MKESEIKTHAEAAIMDSVRYYGTEISADRESAMDAYLGEPYGNEEEGRSDVVTRDVLEVIEWMMPPLMRVFTAGDDVVEYKPEGPEDEAAAQQATDYINFVFYNDNPGFLVLHDMFKDALMQKVGVVKHWWEETEETTTDEFSGLTEMELIQVVSQEGVEVTGQEARLEQMPTPDGQVMEVPVFDIQIKKTEQKGRLRIDGVAPENFLISSRSKSVEDAYFVGDITYRSRTSLIKEGYSKAKVNAIPSFHDRSDEDEGRWDNEQWTEDREEFSSERVRVIEGVIELDVNDDGKAELVKVVMAGSGSYQLLDWEEVKRKGYSAVCPIRIPHKFHGLSVADIVYDIQKIKTVLMRQTLDNLYLTNEPERVINASALENGTLDQMVDRRAGNMYLANGDPNGVVADLTVPFFAGNSFQMIDNLDQQKAERTGLTNVATGVDAEVLQNQSATASNNAQAAAQSRIELIARIFAETGVRDMFKAMLEIVTAHQDKPRVIKLRNEWVEMNPATWSPEMDVAVNVGLGHGNKDQMVGHLMALLNIQKEALQAGGLGIVSPKQIYNAVAQLVKAVGLKDVDQFFMDPEKAPPQQPKPDPAMAEAQAKIQADQMAQQATLQMKQQEAQAELALEKQRAEQEIMLAREKMAAEIQLAREKMQMEATLKAQQVQFEAATSVNMPDVRMGGEMG